MTSLVNIQDLNKVELLRALWEKQIVCARFLADSIPVPELLADARLQQALDEAGGYIHFLCGKFIEANLAGAEADSAAYNAHAGVNAMENVVKDLRKAQIAPVMHAMMNTIREKKLQQRYVPKTVKGDGACFWRCILDGLSNDVRAVMNFPLDVDFANGTRDEVFPHVNKLRVMTAEMVAQLRAEDTNEWRDILTCSHLEGTLESWLQRMRTPMEELEGDLGYADDLAFAMTPYVFRKLKINLDVNIAQRVYKSKFDEIVRTENTLFVHGWTINLIHLIHAENNLGYHYDRLIQDDTIAEMG